MGQNSDLIRVHFLLIPALVFEQGIVFSIAGILLFEDGVYPASILFVSMCMVDLDSAFFMETPWQLGNGIREPDIQIECVHRVLNGLPASRQGKGITLYIVRRPDK